MADKPRGQAPQIVPTFGGEKRAYSASESRSDQLFSVAQQSMPCRVQRHGDCGEMWCLCNCHAE